MKKTIIISLIIVGSLPITGIAQESNDTIPKIDMLKIATVNQGNSYITFPTDIGNIEPLWFEANIVPNFIIRRSKNSRLTGILTPQIIIRMYREESMPVRTPSYLPQIAIYYNLNKTGQSKSNTLFGKFVHHSNGQDGDFYLPDGEINLISGNFSTNSLDFGIINTHYNQKFNAIQFFSTSLEIHPPGWSIEELLGKYSMVRWHGGFSIYKIPLGKQSATHTRPRISLKGDITWMFGDVNDWAPVSADRINLSLTFYFHPRFLEDIGLFVQAYHGMDYYNIYFNHQISVIRFGIMTDILKF